MRRKIAIFTGGRFEYGILRPVIRDVYNSKNLELQLVVSGIHLLSRYGSTIDDIKADKFPIAASISSIEPEKKSGKVSIEIGKGVLEFAKVFIKLKPDIVVVTGDRSEAFAAAIAGAFIPTVVAHIHGGDITKAGFDESIRHAITKISHLHFAATKKSLGRINKMGENPNNVFLVGAPGLDDLISEEKLNKEQLENRLGGSLEGKIIILLQHPVSTSPQNSRSEIRETLAAISEIKGTKILIYPNGDVGSESMIGEIDKYKDRKNYIVVKNLDRRTYSNLLNRADVFVGNSSGGIIETSSFGLPCINIGIRQYGRERNKNVIDVEHNRDKIRKLISDLLERKRKFRKTNIYGDGTAGKKIVKVLEEVKIDLNLLQKHFHEKQNK